MPPGRNDDGNQRICHDASPLLALPAVHHVHHETDFFIGHDRRDGQGNDLTVNSFRDGEGQILPLLIGKLLMRRRRIVDDGLNAVVGKIALELIALFCAHGEHMPHRGFLIIGLRKSDKGIGDACAVICGDFPAAGVVGVEILQLHVQHGGLYLVKARVRTLVDMMVLAVGTVVGDGLYFCKKLSVIGGDAAAVAHAAQVLARVEGKRARVAQIAQLPALIQGAVRLGAVFKHLEMILFRQRPYLFHAHGLTVEMHHHDGTGARRDGLFHSVGVDVAGIQRGFHQHGRAAVFGNGQKGGDVGVGGHDDFIARPEAVRLDDEVERVQPVGHAEGVLRSARPEGTSPCREWS